jgi:hypothetical protein
MDYIYYRDQINRVDQGLCVCDVASQVTLFSYAAVCRDSASTLEKQGGLIVLCPSSYAVSQDAQAAVSGAAVFNVKSICPAASSIALFENILFQKQPVIMYLQAPS